MKRCWHEDPNERPDFTDIRQVMRRINKYLNLIICKNL